MKNWTSSVVRAIGTVVAIGAVGGCGQVGKIATVVNESGFFLTQCANRPPERLKPKVSGTATPTMYGNMGFVVQDKGVGLSAGVRNDIEQRVLALFLDKGVRAKVLADYPQAPPPGKSEAEVVSEFATAHKVDSLIFLGINQLRIDSRQIKRHDGNYDTEFLAKPYVTASFVDAKNGNVLSTSRFSGEEACVLKAREDASDGIVWGADTVLRGLP